MCAIYVVTDIAAVRDIFTAAATVTTLGSGTVVPITVAPGTLPLPLHTVLRITAVPAVLLAPIYYASLWGWFYVRCLSPITERFNFVGHFRDVLFLNDFWSISDTIRPY